MFSLGAGDTVVAFTLGTTRFEASEALLVDTKTAAGTEADTIREGADAALSALRIDETRVADAAEEDEEEGDDILSDVFYQTHIMKKNKQDDHSLVSSSCASSASSCVSSHSSKSTHKSSRSSKSVAKPAHDSSSDDDDDSEKVNHHSHHNNNHDSSSSSSEDGGPCANKFKCKKKHAHEDEEDEEGEDCKKKEEHEGEKQKKMREHAREHDPNYILKCWWAVMHTTALGFPAFPSKEEQRAAINLYGSIGKLLPCKNVCGTHYEKNLTTSPINVSSGESLHRWVVDLHNDVNCRTGKRVWSCDEAKKHWSKYMTGHDKCPIEKHSNSKKDHQICVLGREMTDNGHKYDREKQKCVAPSHTKGSKPEEAQCHKDVKRDASAAAPQQQQHKTVHHHSSSSNKKKKEVAVAPEEQKKVHHHHHAKKCRTKVHVVNTLVFEASDDSSSSSSSSDSE